MIKKLFPSKSLLNINHKNFSQKPFCILTWSDSIVLLFSQKPCICNLCNHLYRSVRFKRTLTEKHVEKYDTDWPNVSFQTVSVSIENLRSHRNNCTKACVLNDFLLILYVKNFRKTKISNFIHSIVNQNIIWFHVSVNDFFAMEYSNTIDNLLKDGDGLIFCNCALIINFFLQRAWVTELKHHNFEILIFEALVALKDVRMVEFHHDFGFFISKSSFDSFEIEVFLGFNGPQIEDFNSNLFVVVFINSAIDFSKGSLTDFLKDGIMLDFDSIECALVLDEVKVAKFKLMMTGFDLSFCSEIHFMFRLNTYNYRIWLIILTLVIINNSLNRDFC